jgi:hypothetical protein
MNHLESLITHTLIAELLDAGYSLGISDGEDVVLRYCDDVDLFMEAMASTDSDLVLVYEGVPQGEGLAWRQVGWVLLIWGNDYDLISDYSDNSVVADALAPVFTWITDHERAAYQAMDATLTAVAEAVA